MNPTQSTNWPRLNSFKRFVAEGARARIYPTDFDASKNLTLPYPTKMAVYGASESGKTTTMCKMLEMHKQMWWNPIDNLVYVNPMAYPNSKCPPKAAIESLKKIFPDMVVRHDMPQIATASSAAEKEAGGGDDFVDWIDGQKLKYRGENTHICLFIDDMQQHFESISASLVSLFSQISHHAGCSVIVTLQMTNDNSKKGIQAFKAIRANANEVMVMGNAPSGLHDIARYHDPFLRVGEQKWSQDAKRMHGCLRQIKRYGLPKPYILLDKNAWNEEFTDIYPARTMFLNEFGHASPVKALLFTAAGRNVTTG